MKRLQPPFSKIIAVTLVVSLLSALPGSEAFARVVSVPAAKTTFPAPAFNALTPGLSAMGQGNSLAAPSLQTSLPTPGISAALTPAPAAAAVTAAAPRAAAPALPAGVRPPSNLKPAASASAPAAPAKRAAQKNKNTALAAGRSLGAAVAKAKSEPGGGASLPALLDRFWNGGTQNPDAQVLAASPAPRRSPLLAPAAPAANAADETPPVGEFRPQSGRVGIGKAKYVYWNTLYTVLQWFNVTLARDPNNKVSWDKWPTWLGVIYLLSKMRWLRAHALTDPYDYKTNDNKDYSGKADAGKRGYTHDGEFVVDNENPQMGAKDTRFGSDIPPMKVRPDMEAMEPSAREAGKTRWRKLDENGEPITIPALILSNLAGWWIQFQFHGFGGNTKRDPLTDNPHQMARKPGDAWTGDSKVERTSADSTRVSDDGRPTVINERAQSWIQAQIYGTSEEESAPLRAYENGHMKLDANGNLLEDPNKPGIDLTGFSNNYSAGLSFLHWIFTVEHNKIADYYRSFHPGWSDDELYMMARKVNVAQMARIHTVEWTEDLLQHPALQTGMHADWYGLLGQKLKMWLMRKAYRHRWVARLVHLMSGSDVLWGMPGSRWEHHEGPFQVPLQFRMVYRLHELVLDKQTLVEPGTGRVLGQEELLEFVHGKTRAQVEKYGYDVLGYSFVKESAGALTLHNMPRALTHFLNQQDDLLARGMLVNASRGRRSYIEERRAAGQDAPASFLELAGGDAVLAPVLERAFDGDLAKVGSNFEAAFAKFLEIRGNMTDLSERDIFRERTDGTGTYNEFRAAVGEKPVASFMELTGGNAALAEELSRVYRGQIDLVDAGIGILAEPKPAGFALSYTQFYQFILNAPRRVKSNRHLTEQFTLKDYGREGIAWIEHGGGMLGVMARGLGGLPYGKEVVAAMEGVSRPFAPWRDADKFPRRLLEEAKDNSGAVFGSNRNTALLGLLTAAAAAWTGVFAPGAMAAVAAALLLPAVLFPMRMLAWRFLQQTEQKVYTDRAAQMLPRVFAAERRTARAAAWGRAGAFGVMGLTAFLAWSAWAANPWVALAFGAAGLSALLTLGKTGRWEKGMVLVKLSLLNRIRAGQTPAKAVEPAPVDKAALDAMFAEFAPGRDYLTAYDFSRMRELSRERAADAGRGFIRRFLSNRKEKKLHKEFIDLYADRIVHEDRRLVPAVSRDMLQRYYEGTAQLDIEGERGTRRGPGISGRAVDGLLRFAVTAFAGSRGVAEEYISPAEEATAKALAMEMVAVAMRTHKLEKTPHPGRPLHRKPLAYRTGTLKARPELGRLPASVQDSWLAELAAGALPVEARFSNASHALYVDDAAKGFHGVGIRVGASAPQDLLMTNKPLTTGKDAAANLRIQRVNGRSKLGKLWYTLMLLLRHPVTALLMMRAQRRVNNPFAETYWSGSAYRLGDRFVKYFIRPDADGKMGLYLQFNNTQKPETTPLENGLIEWREEDSAPIRIADFEFDAPTGTAADVTGGEKIRFDVWNHNGFQPLGNLNRARRIGYKFAQEQTRGRRPGS